MLIVTEHKRNRMKESPRRKVGKVAVKLQNLFGKRKWKVDSDPLSELIATILSQNTSDTNSHRAYASLKSKFETWDQVRKANVKSIANAIKSGGLSEIKAQRIKNILNRIHSENNKLDLTFLKKWKTDKIKTYLNRFKGVGDKTVACVLLFSLTRPVMPVDTHVLRVSKRLGLVPQKADANRTQQILEKLVPKNLFYQFHLDLIQHGRNTCKAGNPRCQNCILLKECYYGKKKLGKSNH
jgi:endonuclease-3